MKKLVILLVFIANSSIFGQDFDSLMTKKQFSCSDVSYNSVSLFEKYYKEKDLTSASNLLSYWESKCGLTEPLFRARLLLSIHNNAFSDSLLTDDVLFYIINYRNRMKERALDNQYNQPIYQEYYGYVPIRKEFDTFTLEAFRELKEKYPIESTEYILCEFYGGDDTKLFEKLQTDAYETSLLAKTYKERLSEVLDMTEYNFSVLAGAWIPTGKLNVLGTHPELGFQLGWKKRKMSYDFTAAFRFLNSANEYMARREKGEALQPTKHFFGGYIGFEVGRDIYKYKSQEIQIIAGAAFDGFTALKEDKKADLESASANSYNFNVGIGYRYYTKKDMYLGVRIKYNIVDYKLTNVIDFTGNPISLQLIIGWLSNVEKKEKLKMLGYKKEY